MLYRWIAAIVGMSMCIAHNQVPAQQLQDMRLVFSTYIGGSNFEQIRDIATDKDGNVYITGGTQSPDYPTTEGAYDRTFATGGTSLGSGGPMDIFVTKFSATGELLWSTFVGGPNYDRAYAIEVDDYGYVYIGGRAGDEFPTTPGALQEEFAGDTSPNGAYGKQDGFIAKLTPDGSALVWATYYGDDNRGFFRDIDVDDAGNVYGVFPHAFTGHPFITSGSFRQINGGADDIAVVKLSPDGASVLWCGMFGGSGSDGGGPSIRVGHDGSVYAAGATNSTDLPATPGAFDETWNGGTNDVFIIKVSPDGSTLEWATYLGGSGNEAAETHNLAIDPYGNAYISSGTSSNDFPITANAYQTVRNAVNNSLYISKISSDGSTLLASTYYGGSIGEFVQGMYADANEHITIGGGTSSADFPTTANAYQAQSGGGRDVFIVKLNKDFSAPLYSTLLGGSREDDGRTLIADEQGNIYIAGQTESNDWPVYNAVFDSYTGTGGNDDGCVAKFIPNGTTGLNDLHVIHKSSTLNVWPQPAHNGCTVSFKELRGQGAVTVAVYSTLGRQVLRRTVHLQAGTYTMRLSTLPPGVYHVVVMNATGIAERMRILYH